MSDMSQDYLSAWCAKEMDQVFGKGWVSRVYCVTCHVSRVTRVMVQGYPLPPHCAPRPLHLHAEQALARRRRLRQHRPARLQVDCAIFPHWENMMSRINFQSFDRIDPILRPFTWYVQEILRGEQQRAGRASGQVSLNTIDIDRSLDSNEKWSLDKIVDIIKSLIKHFIIFVCVDMKLSFKHVSCFDNIDNRA